MMLNIVHQRFCKVNKSILWHSSWCNIALLLPAELVPCSSYWKCNYPTTNPQTLMSICWSVVGRSVIIPKNGRKVWTPCFYRSTCSVYGVSDYMRPMICKKKVKEILIKCQVNYRILKCSYFHLFRKQLFDGKGLCLSLKAVIIKAAVLIQPSWNGGSFFRNQWKTYIEWGFGDECTAYLTPSSFVIVKHLGVTERTDLLFTPIFLTRAIWTNHQVDIQVYKLTDRRREGGNKVICRGHFYV